MSRKHGSLLGMLLLSLFCLSGSGCFWLTTEGPYLGFMSIPIPISPYFQDLEEDQFWEEERYGRVPVLGPFGPGPRKALDEPSDDEVMRALEKARPVEGGLPFLHEVQRNNVSIVKEKIADYVDPPRFYPLIGPAQLHHAHYKCTVYYTEVTRVGWPVPYTTTDEDKVEVIYIDHNHFHQLGNVDYGAGSNY